MKKEIVFLPYQVSMWDALESIWAAAVKDERAKCHVIPIPYYDVNPDGSLGEFHYDGDRYPKEVRIESYLDYDLEKNRPDLIFIHNPYDHANRATRVPERFFARELRKVTDMLVYVPYMVSDPGGPADYQCYTPGVLYADRVVVQPGEIYEKYCRLYTQVLEEHGLIGTLVGAKEKFLPLGSPKLDKLLRLCGQALELPQTWERKIVKPDGEKKKSVVYNTTIWAVLQYPQLFIQKLESVFREFERRKEELVCIWRPHPLLWNSILRDCPMIAEAYVDQIERFERSDWGIYDDTPDPNTAMALSDGYLGDGSSLLTVYRETGKPYMVQKMTEDESDRIAAFLSDVCSSPRAGTIKDSSIGEQVYRRLMAEEKS